MTSKRKYRILISASVTLLFFVISQSFISAQAAKLELQGLDEIHVADVYQMDVELDSPTTLSYLTVIITYDPEILEFVEISSSYLKYNVDHSSGGSIQLNAMNVSIPSGTSIVANIHFNALDVGIASIRVLTASAFSDDDNMIGVNSTSSKYLTVIPAGTEPSIPSITESAVDTEPIQSPPEQSTSLETSSIDTSEETLMDTSSSSEQEVSDSETSSESTMEDSTAEEETSTISTESTESTTEVINTTGDNDATDKNKFRIEIPVIALLLVATAITVILISRKK